MEKQSAESAEWELRLRSPAHRGYLGEGVLPGPLGEQSSWDPQDPTSTPAFHPHLRRRFPGQGLGGTKWPGR